LIKTILALKHRRIPPSLGFEKPNPEIDFEHSPFYVNAALADWPRAGRLPRRAGVSSFGIGGTNAHVVLEEAPAAGFTKRVAPLKAGPARRDRQPARGRRRSSSLRCSAIIPICAILISALPDQPGLQPARAVDLPGGCRPDPGVGPRVRSASDQ
ncbi:MAG: hypothetical protein GY835_03440, partial [bacterium]|nr:hypothetical protein [bacterium]